MRFGQDPTTYANTVAAGVQSLSSVLGISQQDAAKVLLRMAMNKTGRFQGYRGMGCPDCGGGCGSAKPFGDLSTILPDVSTSGLFAAPAIALYAFGAVLLGLGLFAARKKK